MTDDTNTSDGGPPGWYAAPPLGAPMPDPAVGDDPGTAMHYEEPADPEVEALTAEIETTRSRMSDTVDAIGERLDPAHIVEGAKGAVRDATIGKVEQTMQQVADGVGGVASSATDFVNDAGSTAQEAGAGLMDVVRRNPVPAALIGLGVGMLWMNRSNGRSGNRTWSDRGARSRSAYGVSTYDVRGYGGYSGSALRDAG